MNKLLDTMKKKRMPLSFLAGYLPTYILILELQTENPDISEHCINIRTFYQQLSYIYVIYKCFWVKVYLIY